MVANMNKVTCVKDKNYTAISNCIFKDERLSLKSKGLLALLLTLPDDWDFTIDGITSIIKEGKTAIYSAIEELKEYGYCYVQSSRNEKGNFVGNDYTFFETPHIENPYSGFPNMDNQTQQSKDIIQSKDEIKKESKLSKKDELFEECWICYRRKGKKNISKRYWDKLSNKDKENVMPHIKVYVQTREINFQQDFERYLRDKTFMSLVTDKKGNIVYDPEKEDGNIPYTPVCEGSLSWNDYYKCYLYVGYWNGWYLPDGYNDENRPNGASVTLNNGRGRIQWDAKSKEWRKII